MVKRLKKVCPKCNRKGRGLMKLFDEKDWKPVYACQLCGAEFSREPNGDLTYRGQYAVKLQPPSLKAPPLQGGEPSGGSDKN